MSAATASQHPGVEDRDETSDDQSPKRRERRKLLTSERAIATVATALAAYLAVRTETIAKQAGGSVVTDEIRQTVTELRANVANLTTTVNSLGATVDGLDRTVERIEANVDSLKDAKRSFEDALSAYRLSNQQIEFRLGRVEADVARMPARKQ